MFQYFPLETCFKKVGNIGSLFNKSAVFEIIYNFHVNRQTYNFIVIAVKRKSRLSKQPTSYSHNGGL